MFGIISVTVLPMKTNKLSNARVRDRNEGAA